MMTAQRNAGQMLRLINQLLDLSKLEAGQMKLVQSIGELKLFVEEILDSFKEKAKEKNIQLSFSTVGVEGVYRFDKDKWERIITNLLSNAIKFTPFGGIVNVLLESGEEENSAVAVRLTVEDSGPGIPPPDLERIFDRFYQSESTMSGSSGGTGIGLSLVKELIKLMHGTIKVESRPGSGAKFIVEIPLRKTEPAEQLTEETIAAIGGAADKASDKSVQREEPLILIVEDSGELRSYVLASLSDKWRSIAASDGTVGWDLILQEMPDVIISDVMMPGKDGFELCSLCKTDSRTAHIGFILLTSRAAHAARIEGLETGADDYITKPFHQDELEMRIQNLLQLRDKTREFLKAQLLPREAGHGTAPVKDDFINQLYSVIENKLDDPQLNVEYLARTVGMSRSSLNRKLNALLDLSANDLIRSYRLQKGATYLIAGHDISGTAYKVGFTSPSYFAKCFKDEYGLTPTEFISKSVLGQN